MRTLDGIGNVLSGMGSSVDKRGGSYYFHNALSSQQIEACYRSSWLARKIIDLTASEMVRPVRDWQAETADIEPLEKLEKQLGVWPKLQEALRLGNMGGGVIVMGVRQGTPEQPLDVTRVRSGDLMYMHVMHRDEINVGPIDKDPMSPYYGQPRYYEVMGPSTFVRLHPSRVIPFKGVYVPRRHVDEQSHFWGDSILDAVMDAIVNADTAQNGFAALINEAKVDVYGIADFTMSMASPEYEQQLIDRFSASNRAKSLYNAVIKDAEDTWETRQINFTGFKDVLLTYISIVAGAANMPATVLMGKSPDGMNASGDGDKENWYRTIDTMREERLTPALDRLDEVLVRSALGDKPADVWWTFGPLEEESEDKQAERVTKLVNAASVAIVAGMPSEPMLKATAMAMSESGLYPGLDAGIKALEAELANPPEESEEGLTAAVNGGIEAAV